MKRTGLIAVMLFALLASCKGFVAYPDQAGWSHFFLDRKGQVSIDKNGQYRGQLKLELFRPLPVGSRFALKFEKLGDFGAANSVVTLPNVTTYRFRSRVIPSYQVGQSVSVIVTVYEAGASEPIERIRVILPYAEPTPEETKKKKSSFGGLDLLSSNDSKEEKEQASPAISPVTPLLSESKPVITETVVVAEDKQQISWPKLTNPFQALKLPTVSKNDSKTFIK